MTLKPDDEPLGGELPHVDEVAREARLGFVPEFVRKVAVAGLGALFMTEEGIRNLAGQLKLPKEMLGYIVSQAEKTKDDLGRVVSEELRRFLQSEKLREELVRLVAGMTLEVKAELRLKPTPRDAEKHGVRLEITELKTRQAPRKKKD
jgi:hypothetical protein